MNVVMIVNFLQVLKIEFVDIFSRRRGFRGHFALSLNVVVHFECLFSKKGLSAVF